MIRFEKIDDKNFRLNGRAYPSLFVARDYDDTKRYIEVVAIGNVFHKLIDREEPSNITVDGTSYPDVESLQVALNTTLGIGNFKSPSGSGSGTGGGIPEAPEDGLLYGRRDKTWAQVPTGTGSLTEHTDIKSSDKPTVTKPDPNNPGQTITEEIMTASDIPTAPTPLWYDVTSMFTIPTSANVNIKMFKSDVPGEEPEIIIEGEDTSQGANDLVMTAALGFGSLYNLPDTDKGMKAIILQGETESGATGFYRATVTAEVGTTQTVITIPKEVGHFSLRYFLGNTPPKASYWIDADAVSHPFELENTPISDVATTGGSTSNVRINGMSVTKQNIHEIHFGESYKEILTIPNNLCRSFNFLKVFSWPDTATAIGNYTFYACSRLNMDSLPSQITRISEYAFYGCSALSLTKLPSGITRIRGYAFYRCTALALTELPSGITVIEANSFYNCALMALTSLPSGVTTIEEYAFYYCTSLALTSLPSGVVDIRQYAFRECLNLALTSLPSTVTLIEMYAFQRCTKLQDINFNSIDVSSNSFSRDAFDAITNTSACTRRHDTQALADAFGAKYTSMSNWTVVINS